MRPAERRLFDQDHPDCPAGRPPGGHKALVPLDRRLAAASQQFTLEVAPGAGNRPPAIASTPPTAADAGAEYTYQVVASDPDRGDTLGYELLEWPDGMTIDPGSGLVRWTPPAAGLAFVTVAAVDAAGALAVQRFPVLVAENRPPAIRSTPAGAITAGLTYRYDAWAVDPDGDRLTYRLSGDVPAGMAIDERHGLITWETAASDARHEAYAITLTVADPLGAEDTQAIDLVVAADVSRPTLELRVDPGSVDAGRPVTVLARAADDVGVAELVVCVGGAPVHVSQAGTAVVTPEMPGAYEVVATARDAAGNLEAATASFRVRDPDGRAPVADGPLGRFDPTLLPDGAYTLRLSALDDEGRQSVPAEIVVHVEGALKLGKYLVTGSLTASL